MTQKKQSFDFFFFSFFCNQHFTAVFSQNKILCLWLILKRDRGKQGNRDTEGEVKTELQRRNKEYSSSWEKCILVFSDIRENRISLKKQKSFWLMFRKEKVDGSSLKSAAQWLWGWGISWECLIYPMKQITLTSHAQPCKAEVYPLS